MCGSVAKWIGSQTCDKQVVGLNPGWHAAECNPGKVVHPHVPLSPSSIIWYWPTGGDARWLGRWPRTWRKVMAAYHRLWSPAGWLPRTGISSGTLRSFQIWDYIFAYSYMYCFLCSAITQLLRARSCQTPTARWYSRVSTISTLLFIVASCYVTFILMSISISFGGSGGGWGVWWCWWWWWQEQ